MINNIVIENELKETEKQIEDLLLRIKELRKEVQDMMPPEVKKVVHKKVVLDKNNCSDYINLNSYFNLPYDYVKIENYVRYSNFFQKFIFYKQEMLLSNNTVKKEVILTYIPSEKLVIVVER